MLISKFDLCKTEWLDLVFDDRNKAYGAYELRQHYSRTMVKAMAIALLSIMAAAFIVGILIRPVQLRDVPPAHITEVILRNIVHPAVVTPPKPITHIKMPELPPAATHPAVSTRFVTPVLAPDPVATNPPKISDLKGDISTVTTKGPATVAVTPGPPTDGPVTSAAPNPDVVVGVDGLQRMPEPFGGAGAWAKFLQKNLKYPPMAIDQGAQGRVWVGFIVERDGHLSNIVVERGAGYGMDEEALRVLKLAPVWKPGIQNGQPVRVKYNIPINFQLGDE